MVFTDLKKILEKENRLFLILVILLIIGFTFSQFGLLGYGTYIFIFLLGICIVLFIAALIFRIDLKQLSDWFANVNMKNGNTFYLIQIIQENLTGLNI